MRKEYTVFTFFGRMPGQAAFSLIEVVIALAVFAFAFMAIIEALPVGLTSAREASNTLLQAQLVKKVTNTLQETPFTNVVGYPAFTTPSPILTTNYYYSRQGYPVTSASQAYFTMTGTVVPPTDPSAALPSAGMSTNMALVKLVITTTDCTTNYYSTVVANLGSQ